MKIVDQALSPFEIHIDGSNYAVEENTGNVSRQGVELFNNHGYFSTLEGAVDKVAKLKLGNEFKGAKLKLKEYIASYKQVAKEIKLALKM